MPISVLARGRIVEAPVEITSDRGPMTALMLGDAQFGEHWGREFLIEDLTVVEVVCRGPLAASALDQLHVGQPVIVVGTMHLSKPIEAWRDGYLVQVTLEAETIGPDLARALDDPRRHSAA